MAKAQQQERTEDKEDKKTTLSFLPPQSLPKPSPPTPIPNQDSSDLLSPWWSEENEAMPSNSFNSSSSSSSTSSPSSTSTSTSTSSLDADSSDRTLNITLLGFSRKSKVEGNWKERCFMLVTTEKQAQQEEQQQNQANNINNDDDDESFAESVKRLAEESKECSMVCFLRESKRLTNERLATNGQTSIFTHLNPFYGTWISVAKTPMKCKEHLGINDLTKKTEKDYYTFELGDELTHSGDHVKRAFSNTFGPLQRLGIRYIDSWKNGNQQALFTRFWESAKRGDGINLVTYSTKKLIESTIGHDKKSNNKDK